MFNSELKIVLIHGNGGATSLDHWFPFVKKEFKTLGLNVVSQDFPDALVAHEHIWIPFLKNEIKADSKTVLIGHSSGAVASMRYAEQNKIYGSVLVGASYSDLDDAAEKESGYFDRPWNWEKIKSNQKWIVQCSSLDDPYIPINEPRFIHEKLDSEYYEYTDKGHFMIPEFPELVEAIKIKLFDI